MDMIYNVNTTELGINDLLQLVEIVLGEGKYLLSQISSSCLGIKKYIVLYSLFDEFLYLI